VNHEVQNLTVKLCFSHRAVFGQRKTKDFSPSILRKCWITIYSARVLSICIPLLTC